jgi:hypothetical protein
MNAKLIIIIEPLPTSNIIFYEFVSTDTKGHAYAKLCGRVIFKKKCLTPTFSVAEITSRRDPRKAPRAC